MNPEIELLKGLRLEKSGGYLWKPLKRTTPGPHLDASTRHKLLLDFKRRGLVTSYRVKTELINPALIEEGQFGKTHTRYRITEKGEKFLEELGL